MDILESGSTFRSSVDTTQTDTSHIATAIVATERPLNHESPISGSLFMHELLSQVAAGHNPACVVLDVDGTTYTKRYDPETKKWIKIGDNSATSAHMSQNHIPHVIISGRPDWGDKDRNEMMDIGLTNPHIECAGAGTLVYMTLPDGSRVIDQKYLEMMKNTPVTLKATGDKKIETTYKPEDISDFLKRKCLTDPDLNKLMDGVTIQPSDYAERIKNNPQTPLLQIRVDQNAGTGLVVIDANHVPFDQLKLFINSIRSVTQGLTVQIAEDLERVDETTFGGWLQIVPHTGGKAGFARYLAKEVSDALKEAHIEVKPDFHIFGDASIDIWMLGLGNSKKDPYTFHQYALGNLTPHARDRLEPLFQPVDNESARRSSRRANLQLVSLPGAEGVQSVVTSRLGTKSPAPQS